MSRKMIEIAFAIAVVFCPAQADEKGTTASRLHHIQEEARLKIETLRQAQFQLIEGWAHRASQKLPAEIEKLLAEASELDSENGLTHMLLGKYLAECKKEPLAARENLLRAITLSPELTKAFFQLSQLELRLGRLDQSRAYAAEGYRIATQHQEKDRNESREEKYLVTRLAFYAEQWDDVLANSKNPVPGSTSDEYYLMRSLALAASGQEEELQSTLQAYSEITQRPIPESELNEYRFRNTSLSQQQRLEIARKLPVLKKIQALESLIDEETKISVVYVDCAEAIWMWILKLRDNSNKDGYESYLLAEVYTTNHILSHLQSAEQHGVKDSRIAQIRNEISNPIAALSVEQLSLRVQGELPENEMLAVARTLCDRKAPWPDQVAAYDHVIESYPNLAVAYFERARVKYDEALELSERHDELVKVRDNYFGNADFERTATDRDVLRRYSAINPRAMLEDCSTAEKLGLHDNALGELNELIRERWSDRLAAPDTTPADFANAQEESEKLLAVGEFEKGLTVWENLIGRHPQSHLCWNGARGALTTFADRMTADQHLSWTERIAAAVPESGIDFRVSLYFDHITWLVQAKQLQRARKEFERRLGELESQLSNWDVGWMAFDLGLFATASEKLSAEHQIRKARYETELREKSNVVSIGGLNPQLYEEFPRFNRQVEILKRITVSEPSIKQANVWALLGENSIALEGYSRFIATHPETVMARCWRAGRYIAIGAYDQAEEDINRALELHPNSGDAYTLRGVLRQAQLRLDDALADFTKAIELSASRREAYQRRACIYFFRGQFEETRRDIERAATVPLHPWSLLLPMRLEHGLPVNGTIPQPHARITDRGPHADRITNAQLSLVRGDYYRAEEILTELGESESPWSYFTLGVAFITHDEDQRLFFDRGERQSGDVERAKELFRQASRRLREGEEIFQIWQIFPQVFPEVGGTKKFDVNWATFRRIDADSKFHFRHAAWTYCRTPVYWPNEEDRVAGKSMRKLDLTTTEDVVWRMQELLIENPLQPPVQTTAVWRQIHDFREKILSEASDLPTNLYFDPVLKAYGQEAATPRGIRSLTLSEWSSSIKYLEKTDVDVTQRQVAYSRKREELWANGWRPWIIWRSPLDTPRQSQIYDQLDLIKTLESQLSNEALSRDELATLQSEIVRHREAALELGWEPWENDYQKLVFYVSEARRRYSRGEYQNAVAKLELARPILVELGHDNARNVFHSAALLIYRDLENPIQVLHSLNVLIDINPTAEHLRERIDFLLQAGDAIGAIEDLTLLIDRLPPRRDRSTPDQNWIYPPSDPSSDPWTQERAERAELVARRAAIEKLAGMGSADIDVAYLSLLGESSHKQFGDWMQRLKVSDYSNPHQKRANLLKALSSHCSESREYSSAISYLQVALVHTPDDPNVVTELNRLQDQHAIAFSEVPPANAPENVSSDGSTESEFADLTWEIERDPAVVDVKLWAAYARASIAGGHTDQAMETLNHVIHSDPKNMESLLLRSVANLESGDIPAAYKDLLEAESLAPEDLQSESELSVQLQSIEHRVLEAMLQSLETGRINARMIVDELNRRLRKGWSNSRHWIPEGVEDRDLATFITQAIHEYADGLTEPAQRLAWMEKALQLGDPNGSAAVAERFWNSEDFEQAKQWYAIAAKFTEPPYLRYGPHWRLKWIEEIEKLRGIDPQPISLAPLPRLNRHILADTSWELSFSDSSRKSSYRFLPDYRAQYMTENTIGFQDTGHWEPNGPNGLRINPRSNYRYELELVDVDRLRGKYRKRVGLNWEEQDVTATRISIADQEKISPLPLTASRDKQSDSRQEIAEEYLAHAYRLTASPHGEPVTFTLQLIKGGPIKHEGTTDAVWESKDDRPARFIFNDGFTTYLVEETNVNSLSGEATSLTGHSWNWTAVPVQEDHSPPQALTLYVQDYQAAANDIVQLAAAQTSKPTGKEIVDQTFDRWMQLNQKHPGHFAVRRKIFELAAMYPTEFSIENHSEFLRTVLDLVPTSESQIRQELMEKRIGLLTELNEFAVLRQEWLDYTVDIDSERLLRFSNTLIQAIDEHLFGENRPDLTLADLDAIQELIQLLRELDIEDKQSLSDLESSLSGLELRIQVLNLRQLYNNGNLPRALAELKPIKTQLASVASLNSSLQRTRANALMLEADLSLAQSANLINQGLPDAIAFLKDIASEFKQLDVDQFSQLTNTERTQLDKQRLSILRMMADLYQRDVNLNDAVALFDQDFSTLSRLTKEDLGSPEMDGRIDLHLNLGDPLSAIDLLSMVIGDWPPDSSRVESVFWNEALALRGALRVACEDVQGYFDLAYVLANHKDGAAIVQVAEARLLPYQLHQPVQKRALWLMSQAYLKFKQEDFDGAVADLRDATQLKIDDKPLTDFLEFTQLLVAGEFELRGLDHLNAKNYELAKSEFKRAVEIAPFWAIPHDDLFLCHLYQKNRGGELAEVDRLLSILRSSPEFAKSDLTVKALSTRGYSHLRFGFYVGALEDFTEALSISRTANLYKARGLCWHRLGNSDKASQDFDHAIELDPGISDEVDQFQRSPVPDSQLTQDQQGGSRYYQSGSFRFHEGDYEGALADFERANQLWPKQFAIQGWRGRTYLKLRDFDKAEADLKASIAINGNDPGTRRWYGEYLVKQHSFDLAIEQLSKAIELQGKSPDPLLIAERCLAHLGRGNLSESLEDLKKIELLKSETQEGNPELDEWIASQPARFNEIVLDGILSGRLAPRSIVSLINYERRKNEQWLWPEFEETADRDFACFLIERLLQASEQIPERQLEFAECAAELGSYEAALTVADLYFERQDIAGAKRWYAILLEHGVGSDVGRFRLESDIAEAREHLEARHQLLEDVQSLAGIPVDSTSIHALPTVNQSKIAGTMWELDVFDRGKRVLLTSITFHSNFTWQSRGLNLRSGKHSQLWWEPLKGDRIRFENGGGSEFLTIRYEGAIDWAGGTMEGTATQRELVFDGKVKKSGLLTWTARKRSETLVP